MLWNGKEIVSIGDLMAVVEQCPTKDAARAFMREYVLENETARADVGYIAGYYDNQKKHQIFDWFDCVHPIFGTEDRDSETIFKIGLEMGRRRAK